MADLTAEQVEQLPFLKAKTFVAELRAIHIHRGLPGAPATVEIESGHYRLSRKMALIAAKAFAVGADDSSTPRRGRLGAILASMAGMELTPSEIGENNDDEDPDPLQALAGQIATEALGKLQTLIQESVKREFAEKRDALVADAFKSLM